MLELNLVCSGATTLSLAQASLPTVTPLLVMQQLFAKVRAGMSRGSEGWGRDQVGCDRWVTGWGVRGRLRGWLNTWWKQCANTSSGSARQCEKLYCHRKDNGVSS